jgi:hypothetical protein
VDLAEIIVARVGRKMGGLKNSEIKNISNILLCGSS